jgi:hypothetical protein
MNDSERRNKHRALAGPPDNRHNDRPRNSPVLYRLPALRRLRAATLAGLAFSVILSKNGVTPIGILPNRCDTQSPKDTL